MEIMDSFGLILCSIAVDNLPAQFAPVDRALQLNHFPAIPVKWCAHLANHVLATTVSTANFARIMDYLAGFQKLLRSPQAAAQLSPNVRNLFERDGSISLTSCDLSQDI
jgi:hypothetical protein